MYNDNEPAIRSFLAQSDARSITVPHRANRAVIFDSDLFHETDLIAFSERLHQPPPEHHLAVRSAQIAGRVTANRGCNCKVMLHRSKTNVSPEKKTVNARNMPQKAHIHRL